MAQTKQQLIDEINLNVTTNLNKENTGARVNTTLKDMVNFTTDQLNSIGLKGQRDYFTPTAGQTAFTASHIPDLKIISLSTGGIEQQLGADYTVNGNNVNWISTDFALNTDTEIILQYTWTDENVIITTPYTEVLAFNNNAGFLQGKFPLEGLLNIGTDFYGTTQQGGANNFGTIFKYDSVNNIILILHSFNNPNGVTPRSLLVANSGILFGTTFSSGATNGFGTIFSLDLNTLVYTNEHNFVALTGTMPSGQVEVSGNLFYGTTQSGGVNNLGVVFSFNMITKAYVKVYDFVTLYNNGETNPLTLNAGKLYGSGKIGGANNNGVIYSLDITGTPVFTVLYNFAQASGSSPTGKMTLIGNELFGVAAFGGVGNFGALFTYNIVSNIYTKKLDFTGTTGAFKGAQPSQGVTKLGNSIYGTCNVGGDANSFGVIYKYGLLDNQYTVMAQLTGSGGAFKGAQPRCMLSIVGGIIWGTNSQAGTRLTGNIFKISA